MVRKLTLLLSLGGTLVTGYLTLAHLRGAHVSCMGHECDAVQQSLYAQVGSISTAAFGLVFYVCITVLVLMEWLGRRREPVLKLAVTLSLIAAAVSIALTGISAFVIRAYCTWCLVSAGICVLLVPLTFLIRKRNDVERDPALAHYLMDRKYALVVVGVALFTAVRGSSMVRPPLPTAAPMVNLPDLFGEENHILGNVNAPHTLVVFSDFECPRCKEHYLELYNFLQADENAKRIRWVYRHQPLVNHTKALEAALAAEAAAEQGKFFEMGELLYENQAKFDRRQLEGYARRLGLDVGQFRSDIASPKVLARVEKDKQAANGLQINSVPTFYVDGKLVPAGLGPGALKQIAESPAPPSEPNRQGTSGEMRPPSPPSSQPSETHEGHDQRETGHNH